ncbi:hypothetical protein L7F22_061729 [Adiantum nelumboides]|nr:hypothetical protein [Adiantum nelumboides]
MFQEWSKDLESKVSSELDHISIKNTKLQVQNEMLQQRLNPLEDLEKQVLPQENVVVSGVLMEERDLNLVRQQLVEGMQDMWKAMRERLASIVKYPYEAIKVGFVSSYEADLLEIIEQLKREKALCLEQLQDLKNQQLQKDVSPECAVEDSSQKDLPEVAVTEAEDVPTVMDTEVALADVHVVLIADDVKPGKSTTKTCHVLTGILLYHISGHPFIFNTYPKKEQHHLHVDVLQEYAPLQKRRRESLLSQQEKELKRTNKEHHLDLWTNGSIYPKDPTTNAPPPFPNINNLLHFTGDGKDGLLEYTEHLEMRGLNVKKQRNFLAMENMQLKKLNEACSQKILSNRETIQGLEKKITSLREKDTVLGSRKRKRDLCNIENMKIGSGGLKKRIQALRSLLHPNSSGAGCNAGVHYSRLVPKEVVEEMITQKKFCKLKERLLTSFMNENQLEPMEVQAILDECGILQMG